MQNAIVPVLGFVAASGTGKTTLLTELIPILKQNGLRIGLIKHSHHDFEIDQPGKDSFRLRKAGASSVMLVSRYRRAIVTELTPETEPRLDDQLKQFDQSELDLLTPETEPRLDDQLKQFDQSELDLILVEGFKEEQFPKIELHRPSLEKPLLYPNDPDIIAIATDVLLETPGHLMQLELNRPQMIADFIQHHIIKKHD